MSLTGRVDVHNEAVAGGDIRIILNVCEPNVVERRAALLRTTVSDARSAVLVVDDNQDIRETVRLVLEDEGYTVLEAGDGMTALNILRDSQQRLVVLLDHIMPGIDGTETLDLIGRDEQLARRHAYLMMTASSTVGTPEIVTPDAEFEIPLVAKPFDLDELLGAVAQAAASLQPSATSGGLK